MKYLILFIFMAVAPMLIFNEFVLNMWQWWLLSLSFIILIYAIDEKKKRLFISIKPLKCCEDDRKDGLRGFVIFNYSIYIGFC